MYFLFWLIHECLIKRVWFCDVMVERGFRNNLAIHGSFLLRKEVVQTGFEEVSDANTHAHLSHDRINHLKDDRFFSNFLVAMADERVLLQLLVT